MRKERDEQSKPNNEPDKKKGRVYPEEKTNASKVDDTSMSSGNLTNNPQGRERTQDIHTKIAPTGTDTDGQAV